MDPLKPVHTSPLPLTQTHREQEFKIYLLLTWFLNYQFNDYFKSGIHLGAILASVSPAVVVPTTLELNTKGFGLKNQIALLVANAGGLDTAFTEGMFGVINSAVFSQSAPIYRIVKVIFNIALSFNTFKYFERWSSFYGLSSK